MKLQALSSGGLRERLRGDGVTLKLAPFVVRVRSDIPHLADDIAAMYEDFELAAEDEFVDFHVAVLRSPHWLSRLRGRAEFWFDGQRSFTPLPAAQALAMLEWGINWCIAAHAHQFLLIHAAVLERDGRALVMPAPPGSGKSTLCAALAHRGWRLLSDELGLLDMTTGLIHGMARPINLKNASIPLIQGFLPEARFSASMPNTTKGTVALVRAPDDAIAARLRPARPAWVVLPSWRADAPAQLAPIERARAFMDLAEQSFNYDLHGRAGFQALGRLVDACGCYRFEYSRLDEALALFEALAASPAGEAAAPGLSGRPATSGAPA
ncbi:HprK-related kinase A [Roseateles chitosanitabidus]|uniref:HprK-related kinase A n=1 Tax=Roseateles chitosanitabidus TaxID=65048 RepID=UPI0008375F6C|nr:HprK-related kinase A [Roseateles chitosanitabidus]MBO9688394.1 HprK-related kinase A [Roseateles chitosanitabidus]